MKHINFSPIDNSKLSSYLTCKDYIVSKESFSILKDETNDFLITSPRPDDADLGNFYESPEYISHTDSSKTLLDRVYQLVRNYTLKKKLKLINSLDIDGKSVLDIGAGTGDFLAICQKNGWQITGVEPNQNAKNVAENKLKTGLKRDSSEILNIKFDVITMWHVLEHVPNLDEIVIKLKELLKPNGTLIVAVPNHKSFDAKYYGEFWAAYDLPRHLWHFSQLAIKNLFAKKGMKVVKTIPMKFDAYYVSLLSEKYKTKKMKPVTSFLIGFRSNLKAKTTKEYSSLIYIIKNA